MKHELIEAMVKAKEYLTGLKLPLKRQKATEVVEYAPEGIPAWNPEGSIQHGDIDRIDLEEHPTEDEVQSTGYNDFWKGKR